MKFRERLISNMDAGMFLHSLGYLWVDWMSMVGTLNLIALEHFVRGTLGW